MCTVPSFAAAFGVPWTSAADHSAISPTTLADAVDADAAKNAMDRIWRVNSMADDGKSGADDD